MSLIETWDVLKLFYPLSGMHNVMFNRNMGCIEIAVYVLSLRLTWMFNRNMGCIEIGLP